MYNFQIFALSNFGIISKCAKSVEVIRFDVPEITKYVHFSGTHFTFDVSASGKQFISYK